MKIRSLKNQVKKLTQENLMYEERIEALTHENENLMKDLGYFKDTVTSEKHSLKQDVKKLREDASNYKRQMTVLFDDNVRLTQEVNRLIEQMDHVSDPLNKVSVGHPS